MIFRSLRHTNVVAFYGVYSSEYDDYIVTEFCDQGSLKTLLMEQLDEIVLEDLLGM